MMKYIILGLLFYFVFRYFRYLSNSFKKPPASSQKSAEGKMRVDVNSNGKSGKFEEGEYIEFEEVK